MALVNKRVNLGEFKLYDVTYLGHSSGRLPGFFLPELLLIFNVAKCEP